MVPKSPQKPPAEESNIRIDISKGKTAAKKVVKVQAPAVRMLIKDKDMPEGFNDAPCEPLKLMDRVTNISKIMTKEQPDMICFCCKDLASEPTACKKCKTMCCQNCFDEYLSHNNGNCPKGCTSGVKGGTVIQKTKKLLKSLNFKCLFVNFGCRREIAYEQLVPHISSCQFRCVECNECGQLITITQCTMHAKSCKSNAAEINCKQCGM